MKAHGSAETIARCQDSRAIWRLCFFPGPCWGKRQERWAQYTWSNLGAVVKEHASDRVLREASAEQGIGLTHDRRILRVEGDPQPLRPSRGADVSVSQVEPEQLGVVSVGQLEPPYATPAPRAATEATDVPRPAPVADCRARDTKAPGDLAVVDADRDQSERSATGLRFMHEHMFAFNPAESGDIRAAAEVGSAGP